MRVNRVSICVLFFMSVISLVLILLNLTLYLKIPLYTENIYKFIETVLFSIFGSAFVTLIVSIITYTNAKLQNVEEFAKSIININNLLKKVTMTKNVTKREIYSLVFTIDSIVSNMAILMNDYENNIFYSNRKIIKKMSKYTHDVRKKIIRIKININEKDNKFLMNEMKEFYTIFDDILFEEVNKYLKINGSGMVLADEKDYLDGNL